MVTGREGAEDTNLGTDITDAETVMIEGIIEEGAEERLGSPVTDIFLIDWERIVEEDNTMLRGHRFL